MTIPILRLPPSVPPPVRAPFDRVYRIHHGVLHEARVLKITPRQIWLDPGCAGHPAFPDRRLPRSRLAVDLAFSPEGAWYLALLEAQITVGRLAGELRGARMALDALASSAPAPVIDALGLLTADGAGGGHPGDAVPCGG